MSLFHHEPDVEIIVIDEHDPEEVKLLKRILRELHAIHRELKPHTPTSVSFKELTMLDPVAGNTLVYTGTLAPVGSAYPAGTTFTVSSNYPNVSPTVDATGLVVTIPLPADFVDDPANPFSVLYATSIFVPSPSSSPSQISAGITPSIPTVTPTGISFVQTT